MSHDPRQTTRVNFAGWHSISYVRFHVPKSIDDATPSVSNVLQLAPNSKPPAINSIGVAACIAPDTYLGAAHVTPSINANGYLKTLTPQDIEKILGEPSPRLTGTEYQVRLTDADRDICLLNCKQKTSIKPIQLAQHDPKTSDQVYIKTHFYLKQFGPMAPPVRVLPATVVEIPEVVKQLWRRQGINPDYLFGIQIPDNLRFLFSAPDQLNGLSGSPVLNPQGQLVGVLSLGSSSPVPVAKSGNYAPIILGIVKVSEIKKYLTEHEPELAKRLGI